jgi:hypothetical protein
MNVVEIDPGLAGRLRAAGFAAADTTTAGRTLRFRAQR